MKTLGGMYKINVIEHANLNTCQGIIYCYDLKYLSEEEILTGLQKQKVITVRKIKRKINEDLVDTALCVLTFKSSHLPTSIDVGFHRVQVKLFIPNPLRCVNCFKFGHPKKFCNSNRVCALCSETFHDKEPCKSGNHCINCEGPHSNSSKECPRYQREYEIQKIRTTSKLSYFEAKKSFESMYPNFTPNIPNKTSQSNPNKQTNSLINEQSTHTNTTYTTNTQKSNDTNITTNNSNPQTTKKYEQNTDTLSTKAQTSNQINHKNTNIINKNKSNENSSIIKDTTTTSNISPNTKECKPSNSPATDESDMDFDMPETVHNINNTNRIESPNFELELQLINKKAEEEKEKIGFPGF